MSTERQDDEASRSEDHPGRSDEGSRLNLATTEGLTLDVELRFAPAEVFPPVEDDDETFVQVRRALEETLGPEFQKHLAEDEDRVLEWLSDPERAIAFAVDPLEALERLDPPLERGLVEAIRRAASMLEPPPRLPRNVRVRLIGARVERG
jgi:hypothetical protein